MPRKAKLTDPVAKQLGEIQTLLQDILIIQCAMAGIKKSEARKIVGVADARVSSTWRHIKAELQN
jgi:hypothetical protein